MSRPAPWALVPAKGYARAKTRLAPRRSGPERAALARELLAHTLAVLSRCPGLAGVVVVTDADEVAADARARGAEVVRDAGAGLGAAVEAGLAALSDRGAAAALVLMPDLPWVEAADVAALLAGDADVVAAPDQAGRGTNALRLPLPAALATCFGQPDGLRAHLEATRGAGLSVAVVSRERLAFDLDTPDDLDRLAQSREPRLEAGS